MNEDRETPEGFYGGPAYAILRRHFRDWRDKELRETPRMVLLSFGGSDPQGLTLKAARALQALPRGRDRGGGGAGLLVPARVRGARGRAAAAGPADPTTPKATSRS